MLKILKNMITLPNTCFKHTNNILGTIIFSKEDMNMIRIRMIKLCGISIGKALEIIFQNCLRSGKFPYGKSQILFLHLKRVTNSA